MRRRQIFISLVALAVVLVAALHISPSAAAVASPPFACNNDLFFLYNEGSGAPGDEATAHIVRLVVNGPNVTFDPIGAPIGGGLNALGYNPADNFLYAIGFNGSPAQGERSGHLFRIASNGLATDLGIPTGIDPLFQYTAGTFIAPDRMLVSSSSGVGFPVYDVIDIPTKAVVHTVTGTQDTRAFDWATNPLDDKIYGILFPQGQLTVLDPMTGTLTPFGAADGLDHSMGSAWFQNSGQMLLFGSALDVPNGSQNTVFLADAGVNANGTGNLTTLASGPSAGNTDGASCVSLGQPTTTTSSSTSSTTSTTIRSATTSTTTTLVSTTTSSSVATTSTSSTSTTVVAPPPVPVQVSPNFVG